MTAAMVVMNPGANERKSAGTNQDHIFRRSRNSNLTNAVSEVKVRSGNPNRSESFELVPDFHKGHIGGKYIIEICS